MVQVVSAYNGHVGVEFTQNTYLKTVRPLRSGVPLPSHEQLRGLECAHGVEHA